MGKHDMLPFKMTVERGKLIPATPYDAERLDTWRNGTPVNVSFVRDGGRVMERKWWAILNRAVKECKTPWKTAAEASEAIKLAIGVVNLTKTVRGDFLAYPKSLTELDEPEDGALYATKKAADKHVAGWAAKNIRCAAPRPLYAVALAHPSLLEECREVLKDEARRTGFLSIEDIDRVLTKLEAGNV